MTFQKPEDDFFSTGFVIGEAGVLTGQPRAASAICETGVICYHVSQSAMKHALKTYNDPYDSLEARLWRSVGIHRAAAILPTQPYYQVIKCFHLP